MKYVLMLDHSTVSQLFPGEAIHGIKVVDGFQCPGSEAFSKIAIVHAHKRVCVVGLRVSQPAFQEDEQRICLLARLPVLQDWVWDVTALAGDGGLVAVALGHNMVELWSVAAQEARRLRIATSEEHCLLYSAKFFGTTEQSLILASGELDPGMDLTEACPKAGQGRAPFQCCVRCTSHSNVASPRPRAYRFPACLRHYLPAGVAVETVCQSGRQFSARRCSRATAALWSRRGDILHDV